VPSRFVGVKIMDHKYVALGPVWRRAGLAPGSISLGSFFLEEDAARVYDRACIYQVA